VVLLSVIGGFLQQFDPAKDDGYRRQFVAVDAADDQHSRLGSLRRPEFSKHDGMTVHGFGRDRGQLCGDARFRLDLWDCARDACAPALQLACSCGLRRLSGAIAGLR
jgi:hypothetical protein